MNKKWIKDLKSRHYDAFTLLEMLIVLTIIGILMAIGLSTFSNVTNSAKKTASLVEIDQLKIHIFEYNQRNNMFPKSITSLLDDNTIDKDQAQDAWDNYYQLSYKTKASGAVEVTISSAGPDKKYGTKDDVFKTVMF